MRLAHLADPHLGFRQYHRLNEKGRNQREVDVASAFASAIDGVIAARPDAVVVAGDLFHNVRPTNSAILHALQQFVRLQRALPQVPVVVIAGNHDTPRSSDTVSIFGVLREVGVHVAADRAQRFSFPALDLSILGVPHQALIESPRVAFEPGGPERHQVLLIHGETEDLFPHDAENPEPGGARLLAEDLRADWSYIALGHYHVQRQVGARQWYAGSLDYVSTNPWRELREERDLHARGKGWLLVDLETGAVTRQAIAAPRRFLDLRWLDADDLAAAEINRLIADAVAEVPGGIAGAVVRQVLRGVPRAVARELDHARIRSWKNEALHFQLDLRPPERQHTVASGAPGHRQTLPDIVEGYLGERQLPASLDRAQFVATGLEFLAAADHSPGEG
jgi:DNA repair exonuclease SbcCD nuclease subunit